jgi:hypothetical protein
MTATDKFLTKKAIKIYGKALISLHRPYLEEDLENLNVELNAYLCLFSGIDQNLKKEYEELSGKQFWGQYGKDQWPLLNSR